jgi:hypothetical protein
VGVALESEPSSWAKYTEAFIILFILAHTIKVQDGLQFKHAYWPTQPAATVQQQFAIRAHYSLI